MMRRFACYRLDPPAGYLESGAAVDPGSPQFEGVVFSDGTVCLRWMTMGGSFACWPSMDDVLAIHGHPEYGTKIVWLDEP